MIDASSSKRFSMGVPVSTRRYGASRDFTYAADFVAQFLMRCASSSTTISGANSRTPSRSRSSCSYPMTRNPSFVVA